MGKNLGLFNLIFDFILNACVSPFCLLNSNCRSFWPPLILPANYPEINLFQARMPAVLGSERFFQLPAACQSQLHDWGWGTRRLAARHWSWVADLLRCPWGQASLPTLCEGWGWISLSCQTMLEMNVIHQWNESLGPVALAWHSRPAPGPVFLLHLINCMRYVFQWFHRGQTPPVIMGENGSVEKFPEKHKRMKNSYLRGATGWTLDIFISLMTYLSVTTTTEMRWGSL